MRVNIQFFLAEIPIFTIKKKSFLSSYFQFYAVIIFYVINKNSFSKKVSI